MKTKATIVLCIMEVISLVQVLRVIVTNKTTIQSNKDECLLLMCPSEIIVYIKKTCDPVTSRMLCSTCSTLMALTTQEDTQWLHQRPLAKSVQHGLERVGMTLERLRDTRKPSEAKSHWPPIFTTGKKTPVSDSVLKRYVLNIALLNYLTLLGLPVTDNHGNVWDNTDNTQVVDKSRYAFICIPLPKSGQRRNCQCTLSYQFHMTGGEYSKITFAQNKGENASGIDQCFEQAIDTFEYAMGDSFSSKGIHMLLETNLSGGSSTPRITASREAARKSRRIFAG